MHHAFTTDPEAQRWSSTRIVSLQVVLHASWVTGATLGGLLVLVLPGQVLLVAYAAFT